MSSRDPLQMTPDILGFPDVIPCPSCHGAGVYRWRPNVGRDTWADDEVIPCPTCDGAGIVRLVEVDRHFMS